MQNKGNRDERNDESKGQKGWQRPRDQEISEKEISEGNKKKKKENVLFVGKVLNFYLY